MICKYQKHMILFLKSIISQFCQILKFELCKADLIVRINHRPMRIEDLKFINFYGDHN